MRGSTRGSEAQLIERSRRLDVLRVVTGEITRELDLDRALTLVIHGAMKLVGATGGLVYLFDEETKTLRPRVWANAPEGRRTCHLLSEKAWSVWSPSGVKA